MPSWIAGIIWSLVSRAITAIGELFFSWQKQKEHDVAVEKDIERTATSYDEVVAKGKDGSREERRKDAEDVLNSGN